MCWVSLCPWLFKIVVWILGASCLYGTPTWVFNKHLKLHLPKVELLVTPQPTKNLLSHLPGCSRKIPRVILNSCLSLSPQPICRQLLLILLPKCVTDSLGSPHHCCCLLVQSPPFLFWTAARVFWPVSMLPRDLCSTKQRESSFKGFSPPLKVITLFEVMSWSSTAVKLKSWPQGSYDGGGIGWGDHFLPHKFIKRTFERWVSSTKQLQVLAEDIRHPEKQIIVFKNR